VRDKKRRKDVRKITGSVITQKRTRGTERERAREIKETEIQRGD